MLYLEAFARVEIEESAELSAAGAEKGLGDRLVYGAGGDVGDHTRSEGGELLVGGLYLVNELLLVGHEDGGVVVVRVIHNLQ